MERCRLIWRNGDFAGGEARFVGRARIGQGMRI
jgi:hypothetical protein